jgi:hypothetical protein
MPFRLGRAEVCVGGLGALEVGLFVLHPHAPGLSHARWSRASEGPSLGSALHAPSHGFPFPVCRHLGGLEFELFQDGSGPGDGSNPAHGQAERLGAATQSAEVFALPEAVVSHTSLARP